jgi:hypothetical protein
VKSLIGILGYRPAYDSSTFHFLPTVANSTRLVYTPIEKKNSCVISLFPLLGRGERYTPLLGKTTMLLNYSVQRYLFNFALKVNFQCIVQFYYRFSVGENIFSKLEVQSDQQESKSEQALQIIGHVVAKSYAHKR